MAAGAGGGSGSAAEDEAAAECSWVPMRVRTLRNILLELDTSLEQRWCEFQWERRWEAAAAAADPDDAAQRQDLTRRLLNVSSLSWYAFTCMLRRVEDDLDEPRPRPDSAYWWLWCHGGGNSRFVHLSQGEAARARELWTDAYARTQRSRAVAKELDRLCGQGPAVAEEDSMPRLVERLRRLQRLNDAVLVPVGDLKRLVEHLIGDDDRAEAREGRRRGRSAPPPRRRMQGAFRCSSGMT